MARRGDAFDVTDVALQRTELIKCVGPLKPWGRELRMQKQNGGSAARKKGKGRTEEERRGEERRRGETDDVFRCQTMLAEYKTEERPRPP